MTDERPGPEGNLVMGVTIAVILIMAVMAVAGAVGWFVVWVVEEVGGNG